MAWLVSTWIGNAVKVNDRGLLWDILPTLAQNWGTWYRVTDTKFKSDSCGLNRTSDTHSTMTCGYSYSRVTTSVHAHSSALWTWTWTGRERPVARVLHKSKCNFTLPMMYKSIISEYCVQTRRETSFLKRGSGISTDGADVIGKSSPKYKGRTSWKRTNRRRAESFQFNDLYEIEHTALGALVVTYACSFSY